MNRIAITLALMLSGLLGSSLALAADAPERKASGPVATACVQDIKTLCPGVEPGDGRIMACMKEHRRKLSSGCKDALKAQRAAK